MKNKKKIYSKSIDLYGTLPIVFMLEENEKKENFKECKIILEAIKEYSEKHNIKISTNTEKTINFEEAWSLGELIENSLYIYVAEIENQLNKLK